jgi:hypothetical protein
VDLGSGDGQLMLQVARRLAASAERHEWHVWQLGDRKRSGRALDQGGVGRQID